MQDLCRSRGWLGGEDEEEEEEEEEEEDSSTLAEVAEKEEAGASPLLSLMVLCGRFRGTRGLCLIAETNFGASPQVKSHFFTPN